MNRKKAITHLKDHGYQVTKQRKDIINFFETANGYRTARALIAFMEKQYENVGFDIINRKLHLCNELNILEKQIIQGEKQFRMSCTDEHHHHFKCNDCGKTKEIYFCPMNYVAASLDKYAIEDHKFEVYGLCPTCKSA